MNKMKIINNEKEVEVLFKILKGGDVFEWAGNFYIKTTGEEAVRLDDGELDCFVSDFKVHPVEAILTIS